MPRDITDEDLELLGDLGVDAEAPQRGGRSAREQRIIAGFEEIEHFVQEHGRRPQHGENRDIFERLYAVRLDRIRESAECREALQDLDSRKLLGKEPEPSEFLHDAPLNDEALLASLGVAPAPDEDVTRLVHVRSRDEVKSAGEIAQRNPCPDFEMFRPLFERVQRDLASGIRRTLKYQDNTRA